MDDYASAFGFREWPFRIVVDEKFAEVWADRGEVRRDLEKRMRRMKGLPHSTVQLIWADFGAGKSHSLRHIEANCKNDLTGQLFAVYTEMPVEHEGLIGLYRQFANAIPQEFLVTLAGAVLKTKVSSPRSLGGRDFMQALRLISSNDYASQALALEWIRALPRTPHLNSLRSAGMSGRIEDEARVVDVVAELVRMHRETSGRGSLVWLVDEFQRTADLPTRKRDAFAKALVSLFNASTAGLHLILSFSVAQQETVAQLIPPDLKSRAGAFPMLALPYLTPEDAALFCTDLFTAFRSDENNGDAYHPFTRDSLSLILKRVDKVCSSRV